MLGSGWPLLLRPRDGAQGLPEVDWLGSEDLSDSEVDDTDRLPREEDLDEEDKLPMAAEVVRWVEEGLGGNAAPTDDMMMRRRRRRGVGVTATWQVLQWPKLQN